MAPPARKREPLKEQQNRKKKIENTKTPDFQMETRSMASKRRLSELGLDKGVYRNQTLRLSFNGFAILEIDPTHGTSVRRSKRNKANHVGSSS